VEAGSENEPILKRGSGPAVEARIPLVRRFWGFLLLAALAIPASLALPSARVAEGASCAMACDHGDAEVCCCKASGAASFRRCSPADGSFLPVSAPRVVLAAVSVLPAPALAGWRTLPHTILLPGLVPDRPDPVPRLLS